VGGDLGLAVRYPHADGGAGAILESVENVVPQEEMQLASDSSRKCHRKGRGRKLNRFDNCSPKRGALGISRGVPRMSENQIAPRRTPPQTTERPANPISTGSGAIPCVRDGAGSVKPSDFILVGRSWNGGKPSAGGVDVTAQVPSRALAACRPSPQRRCLRYSDSRALPKRFHTWRRFARTSARDGPLRARTAGVRRPLKWNSVRPFGSARSRYSTLHAR
jgi:hypothetical protein